jgi:hypothetical protein
MKMLYLAKVDADNVSDYLTTPDASQLAELLRVADIRTGGEGVARVYEIEEAPIGRVQGTITLLACGTINDCIKSLKEL